MRRERTLRSTQENQGGKASSTTLDTERSGDLTRGAYCTSDIGARVCFFSTSTAWAGMYLWGLTGSIWSDPELAFYGRERSTFYRASRDS